jgi:hypothetical protein
MTEFHRLSVHFRQKAEECSAEFKQSHDPAEAAAAYAYNEAAGEIERMADPPELTEDERRHITLTALRQAAFDGQKTTLARIHYSHLARAADEIERLTALAQSNAEHITNNLPPLPDDDADFTPALARQIISKYQEAIRAPAQSDAEPQSIRNALQEMLVGAKCETTGLEDLEPGCCRVCRARAAQRCLKAADEIERLTAENERLKEDAECWRRRND